MTSARRLLRLKNLGRVTEGLQVLILLTFGQYLYSGGAQQLKAKHWENARDFFGGYQGVGLSILIIAVIGLVGLFSLAVTETDHLYTVIMWIFTLAAVFWFMGSGISHALAQSGSTGLWSLGMTALWFLTTRMAITIAAPLHPEKL